MITAARGAGTVAGLMTEQSGEEDTAAAAAAERKGGVIRATLRLVALASALLLAVALVGHVVRDRTWWLALMMYVPLVLVAPFALVAQLAAFERRAWKRRALVIIVSAVAWALAVRDLRGGGVPSTPPPGAVAVRVVQWNVQWGRDEPGWRQTAEQIAKAASDVVVLSEAPTELQVATLCARLGPEWSFRSLRNPQRGRYWYAMAVLSRWPIVAWQPMPLTNGVAMRVEIEPAGTAAGQRWRVLAVDGMSDPLIPRTPMLHGVANIVADAASEGAPIDVIAGDFNAVARSVGFGALERAGFTLASRSCRGWRGTFPSFLPAYDIDHVWLGDRHAAAGCAMLDSPGTNHRGMLVHVTPRPPK